MIALGLGVEHMTVEDCTRWFKELCIAAFQTNQDINLPVVTRIYNSNMRLLSDGMENIFRDTFQDRALFSYDPRNSARYSGRFIPVAVTASTLDGKPFVLGNYNRKDEDHDSDDSKGKQY